MNELNITEYAVLHTGVGLEPALRAHSVSFNSNAVDSELLNQRTSFVRLISDVDCRVRFTRKEDIVKDNGSIVLAGTPEYFAVNTPPLHISVVEL